jgi:glyoxylase-like metal-dependent hydrolase (beta-lactamase superfamily II)
MRSATLVERLRYRPAQWAHAPRFELYRGRGERWFGFESVGALRGLPDDVLLVPLVGHTRGHTGVAVRDASGWMLHAGDAYMHHGTIDGGHVPTALRVMQRLDDMDRAARVANQRRVRTLAASGDARVFCAHDPSELAGYT